MTTKLDPIKCKEPLSIHKESGKLVILCLAVCNTNCIITTLFEINAYDYYTGEYIEAGVRLDRLTEEFEFPNIESLQSLLIQMDNIIKEKIKTKGEWK